MLEVSPTSVSNTFLFFRLTQGIELIEMALFIKLIVLYSLPLKSSI